MARFQPRRQIDQRQICTAGPDRPQIERIPST